MGPIPGAGPVRAYSLPANEARAGMFTQPAHVVSPPERSIHSNPDYATELGDMVGRSSLPMGNSFPTFIPGMQRAAASNIGIESALQGPRMLVVPPDRYNALTARIRKPRDVRAGFWAARFSRRRTPAPAVGS